MKTLNAKTLKAKKDNLRAKFDQLKESAQKYDNVALEAMKKRDACLGQMSSLQGAFKAVEDLEKELGLPAKADKPKAKRRPKKKKK